jgi:hypothetical protein
VTDAAAYASASASAQTHTMSSGTVHRHVGPSPLWPATSRVNTSTSTWASCLHRVVLQSGATRASYGTCPPHRTRSVPYLPKLRSAAMVCKSVSTNTTSARRSCPTRRARSWSTAAAPASASTSMHARTPGCAAASAAGGNVIASLRSSRATCGPTRSHMCASPAERPG